MKFNKKVLGFIIASYVFVLLVNLVMNGQYYAAGNDWRYSVSFCIFMTTICLGGFSLLNRLVFRKMKWLERPTLKIMLGAVIFAIGGAAMSAIGVKAMVWFFHFQDFSFRYIETGTWAALFSLIMGMMITAHQTLIQLKKSVEENEHMKQEMIQSQYETLKSQVNPHFLFNSLNTLTVMIPRQPDVAVEFVEQLSKVFRYSLQHSGQNTIDIGTELKVVQSYLFLNRQRYNGKLVTEIKVSDAALERKIITQSLLMLVENAVKHNEISAEQPLTIQVYDEGDYLVVSNILQRKSLLEHSTGIGLENIKKRYALASSLPVVIDEGNKLFTVKIPFCI